MSRPNASSGQHQSCRQQDGDLFSRLPDDERDAAEGKPFSGTDTASPPHNAYAAASQPSSASRRPPHGASGSSTGTTDGPTADPTADTEDGNRADGNDYRRETGSEQERPDTASSKSRDLRKDEAILQRLMKDRDVAQYLSIDRSTVRRLAQEDPDFPKPRRVGGSTRWDRAEIDAYVDHCERIGSSDS